MEGQGLYVMYEHNGRGPWCPAFQKKESWGSLFLAAPRRSKAGPARFVRITPPRSQILSSLPYATVLLVHGQVPYNCQVMRTFPHFALLFALLASLPTASSAKDKHLPLPAQITAAKTVYIDNQSGVAKLGDRCYTQIEKWGRFKVVQDRKDADLIFLLSANEYTRGYVTSGGGSTSTVNSSGNVEATTIGDQTTGTVNTSGTVNTTTEPTYTRPVTVGYTYLTVIDPKTGSSLWSDSKRWGNLYTGFHSATKGLVDDLMKRIREDSRH
jgi:hypothetical protein